MVNITLDPFEVQADLSSIHRHVVCHVFFQSHCHDMDFVSNWRHFWQLLILNIPVIKQFLCYLRDDVSKRQEFLIPEVGTRI